MSAATRRTSLLGRRPFLRYASALIFSWLGVGDEKWGGWDVERRGETRRTSVCEQVNEVKKTKKTALQARRKVSFLLTSLHKPAPGEGPKYCPLAPKYCTCTKTDSDSGVYTHVYM